MLGRPIVGDDHVLLNRDLFHEFAAFLAAAEWDAALLQEVPPRWARRLAEATGSDGRASLTSRNWMRPFTFVAARSRPHLPGSWEGGSNLILVRRDRPGAAVVEHRRATLTWRPERRVVSLVRLDGGLCLANLHASTGRAAAADVMRAAELAVGWAGEDPLVLGGDFNARPARSDVFSRLESDYGLSGAAAADSIDHLLVRGAESFEPGTAWPPARRDVPDAGSESLIRLSDHPPVLGRVVTPG